MNAQRLSTEPIPGLFHPNYAWHLASVICQGDMVELTLLGAAALQPLGVRGVLKFSEAPRGPQRGSYSYTPAKFMTKNHKRSLTNQANHEWLTGGESEDWGSSS